MRYGWLPGKKATPEMLERVRQIGKDLTDTFVKDDNYELVNINTTYLDGKLHFLLEIMGPDTFPQQKVKTLEGLLAKRYSEPIKIYAWSRIEVVNDSEGPLSLAGLQESFSDRQKENLPEEIPMLLEASGR
jgi:hypothetical protein